MQEWLHGTVLFVGRAFVKDIPQAFLDRTIVPYMYIYDGDRSRILEYMGESLGIEIKGDDVVTLLGTRITEVTIPSYPVN